MKPELEQEIWHIGSLCGDLYLHKMRVGYIGKERFVCYGQFNLIHDKPIAFTDYGVEWFLTEEEALDWLKRNDYEWNNNIRAYTKKENEDDE